MPEPPLLAPIEPLASPLVGVSPGVASAHIEVPPEATQGLSLSFLESFAEALSEWAEDAAAWAGLLEDTSISVSLSETLNVTLEVSSEQIDVTDLASIEVLRLAASAIFCDGSIHCVVSVGDVSFAANSSSTRRQLQSTAFSEVTIIVRRNRMHSATSDVGLQTEPILQTRLRDRLALFNMPPSAVRIAQLIIMGVQATVSVTSAGESVSVASEASALSNLGNLAQLQAILLQKVPSLDTSSMEVMTDSSRLPSSPPTPQPPPPPPPFAPIDRMFADGQMANANTGLRTVTLGLIIGVSGGVVVLAAMIGLLVTRRLRRQKRQRYRNAFADMTEVSAPTRTVSSEYHLRNSESHAATTERAERACASPVPVVVSPPCISLSFSPSMSHASHGFLDALDAEREATSRTTANNHQSPYASTPAHAISPQASPRLFQLVSSPHGQARPPPQQDLPAPQDRLPPRQLPPQLPSPLPSTPTQPPPLPPRMSRFTRKRPALPPSPTPPPPSPRPSLYYLDVDSDPDEVPAPPLDSPGESPACWPPFVMPPPGPPPGRPLDSLLIAGAGSSRLPPGSTSAHQQSPPAPYIRDTATWLHDGRVPAVVPPSSLAAIDQPPPLASSDMVDQLPQSAVAPLPLPPSLLVIGPAPNRPEDGYGPQDGYRLQRIARARQSNSRLSVDSPPYDRTTKMEMAEPEIPYTPNAPTRRSMHSLLSSPAHSTPTSSSASASSQHEQCARVPKCAPTVLREDGDMPSNPDVVYIDV